MNARQPAISLLALFGVALLATTPHDAAAITLRTQVAAIHQVGVGAGVSLGHAVIATTNYNRLTAGGSYTASCISPLMSPTLGARTLSAENLVGGLQLVTTVPEWFPTIVNMPGYNDLPAGTVVTCTYNWNSEAVEGGYSIGTGGVTFQTGNGKAVGGNTQMFIMVVPGVADDRKDGGTCIP